MASPDRPGKISPEGGEPEKGAPDVGETLKPSGADPHDGDEPFPPNPQAPEDRERGQRASFDPVSGEVHGSGSGAGGGGNRDEDYDSDPMAGSGAEPAGAPRPIDRAVQRPIDPDEGT